MSDETNSGPTVPDVLLTDDHLWWADRVPDYPRTIGDVIDALNSLGGDTEPDHAVADKLLRIALHLAGNSAVAEAYEALAKREGEWWFA